ncbi:AtpZ/AtpI family protein [candidate division KSB1 bacterium]|nr:AtpZ/AtpI family protein [candidate division KSB1 bacterium]
MASRKWIKARQKLKTSYNKKKSPAKTESVDKHIKSGVGPYLDLGLQLAVAVAIGFGLGYLADSSFHSRPVFIIIGVLLGATAGMLNIYRTVYPRKNE